jgi:hypothetical protein
LFHRGNKAMRIGSFRKAESLFTAQQKFLATLVHRLHSNLTKVGCCDAAVCDSGAFIDLRVVLVDVLLFA